MLVGLESVTGIKRNARSFQSTFAIESVRNGMNLFHVQSLLGHSSLVMTRIYNLVGISLAYISYMVNGKRPWGKKTEGTLPRAC